MPIVLFIITAILGGIFAFVAYEEVFKEMCKSLWSLPGSFRDRSTIIRQIKSVGAILLCIVVYSLLAAMLFVFAVCLWAIMYCVFLIPCMILYVVVAIRKQYIWQAETDFETESEKARNNENMIED